MSYDHLPRICGTCARWNPEGGDDFRERLKARGKDPTCKLNKKVRYKNDMAGCLAWKAADPWDIETRGYPLDPPEGEEKNVR